MRGTLLLGLVLIALAASGCKTAVGNYFGNRLADFGDCFHADIGVGPGLGAGVRGAGIADVQLGISMTHVDYRYGWSYGELSTDAKWEAWPFDSRAGLPLMGVSTARRAETWVGRASIAVPSALFTNFPNTGPSIWFPDAIPGAKHSGTPSPERFRWERIHAFDLEVWVHAFAVSASVGFSFGEFADFLLGWFGLDFAGDDTPWPPPSDK